MKFFKKLLIFFTTFFFVLLLIAYIFLKTGILTEQFKNYARTKIYELSGKDIDIEKIELGFVNNVTIKNIKIPLKRTLGEGGEFIDVSSIVFRFNLIDLFFHRKNIDETLSHIIVNNPVFHLKRENGVFNIEEFIKSFILHRDEEKTIKSQIILPVNRIFIENGKIIYEDVDKNFSTTLDFKGSLTYRQKSNSIRVFVTGNTAKNNRNNIKVDFNYYISNNFFKSDIQIRDEPLGTWLPYFFSEDKVKVNEGSFTANLSLEGGEFKTGKFKMHGFLSASRGNLSFFNNRVDNFNTDITITDDRINFKMISFNMLGGECKGSGNIGDIFGHAFLDGNLTFSNVDVALITNNLISGKMRGGLVIKGDKYEPSIMAKMFVDSGNFYKADINNLEAKILFNKKEIQISSFTANIGDGVLIGNGAIPFEGDLSKTPFNIMINNINVSKIFDNKDFKGVMDVIFRFNGSLQNPKFFLQLSSDKIDFYGNTVSRISSVFSFDEKKLNIDGKFSYNDYEKLQLNSIIEIDRDLLKILFMKLDNNKDTIFNAIGSYNFKSGLIDIESNINSLKISSLGIPVIKGRDIDGNINSKIILKGTSISPEMEMVVEIPEFLIKKKRNSFRCKINFKNNTIKFSELLFNENLAGSGEFSLKNKIFNVTMDIKQLEGYVLRELTGLDLFNNSIIDGTIFIKKQQDGYGGSIAIESSYIKGDYKSIGINIKGEKNEFVINSINLKQIKGGLNGAGWCRYVNDELLNFFISGAAKDFKVNDKMKLSGNFKADSSIAIIEGIDRSLSNLYLTGVYLNNKQIGNVSLNLKTKKAGLPSILLKIGDEYLVDIKPRTESGREINFLLQFKNADLLPYYALMNLRNVGLNDSSLISGKISIDGDIQNAAVAGNISQKNGTMSLTGNIGFAKYGFLYKPIMMNLQYNFVNMGLKEIMSIFSENVKESGRINGSGILKGKIDNPESEGNITLSSGIIFGLPYDSIITTYNIKNKKINLKKLFFEYRKTFFNIYDSVIEIMDNNQYYVTLKSNLKDYVWRGNRLNGDINFYGRIENQNGLKIDGSIGSDNFMFKNHKFLPFVLKINFDDKELTIKTSKGKSVLNANIKDLKEKIIIKNLSVENEKKECYFSGKGEIQKEKGDSNLIFEVFNMNPQMINDLMGWDYKWTGGLNGSIKVSRNIKEGLAFTMFLTINNGSVNNLDFDIFTGVISLKDHWVDLSPVSPLLLSKTDKYDIKITGKIPAPMSEEGVEKLKGVPMDVRAVIKNGDLSVIKFINWIDDAEGPIDMDLHITGTKEFPVVDGKLVITDARAKIKYLFNSLDHIFANIFIKDNIIDIYSFRADTQKGTLKISNLTEKNGGTMKWIKPYEANWKVTNIGDKIRITDTRYMEFIDGDADIDLEITGPLSGPTVKGVMRVSDMRYRYPVKMKNQKGEITDLKNNYAKQINWDLKVYGGDNVYYYNDDYVNTYAQIYLQIGDNPLLIQGRNEDLKIYGNIKLPRGVYKYMNTEFSIDQMAGQSTAVFDGLTRPILNVYATAKIRRIELGKTPGSYGVELPGIGSRAEISGTMDLNINMKAWGRVGDIKIDLTSEPSLDRNRLLYILTFGKDAGGLIAADDAYKMAEALANAWIKGRTEEIKKFTPLDVIDIKVSDVVPRAEATPEEGITPTSKTKMELGIGKYLTEQFYFDYRMRLLEGRSLLGEPNLNLYLEHSLGFEYSLDPTNKLVLEGVIKDPTFSTYRFEGFMGLESRFSFDAWGAKPTPTPSKK
ncbi:MAG: translocation/assembly module TamB domain-containing protein [Candidatus Goldbacteria bacterium]|nr:translocation/assembly module TamB domain-containing protein [Candidatus Goldiibacteriota bacterium]